MCWWSCGSVCGPSLACHWLTMHPAPAPFPPVCRPWAAQALMEAQRDSWLGQMLASSKVDSGLLLLVSCHECSFCPAVGLPFGLTASFDCVDASVWPKDSSAFWFWIHRCLSDCSVSDFYYIQANPFVFCNLMAMTYLIVLPQLSWLCCLSFSLYYRRQKTKQRKKKQNKRKFFPYPLFFIKWGP